MTQTSETTTNKLRRAILPFIDLNDFCLHAAMVTQPAPELLIGQVTLFRFYLLTYIYIYINTYEKI